jgi:hypothetical protein
MPLGKTTLAEAVARNLFKLMAYKDEYEVARLHTDRAFLDRINGMFEGDFKLNYHLAPPMIAKRTTSGELQKRKFGPAMLTAFRLLARLKGLRGTAFDVFGRTEERRTERALIGEYRRQCGANAHIAECGQPWAGPGDRPPAGADQGLWPRQGAQPGRGARSLGRADAAMA